MDQQITQTLALAKIRRYNAFSLSGNPFGGRYLPLQALTHKDQNVDFIAGKLLKAILRKPT